MQCSGASECAPLWFSEGRRRSLARGCRPDAEDHRAAPAAGPCAGRIARGDRGPPGRTRRGPGRLHRRSSAATTRARRPRWCSSTPSIASLPTRPAVLARHAGDRHVRPSPDTRYRLVAQAPADFHAAQRPRPVVVGFGPCGIFAALVLAQMGLRPIVLERGKEVRERTKDTWGLWRQGVLDPESNVQFGEGGAGTFSDGKLWSQISDPRHLTRKVLERVRQGRCAGRDSLRRQAAHRHLPAGEHGREDARRHRGAGRRDPLPAARDRHPHRRRPPRATMYAA